MVRVPHAKLVADPQGEPSSADCQLVAAARQKQAEGYKDTRLRTKVDMGPAEVRRFCALDGDEQRLVRRAGPARTKTGPTNESGRHHQAARAKSDQTDAAALRSYAQRSWLRAWALTAPRTA